MQTRRSTRLSTVVKAEPEEPPIATTSKNSKDNGAPEKSETLKTKATTQKRKKPPRPEKTTPKTKKHKPGKKAHDVGPPKNQVAKQKVAPQTQKITKEPPKGVIKAKPSPVIPPPEGPLRIPEQTDPIINHLKGFFKSVPDSKKKAIDDEIIDQISLEGLAGVTPIKLFQILDAIFPTLSCTKNDTARKYVWSVIIKRYLKAPVGANVEVYYVPPGSETNRERQHVEAPTRKNKYPMPKLQFECPVKLPQSTIDRHSKSETYLHPVQDGRIMGSCAYYKARIDVTWDILKLFEKHANNRSKAMDEINQKYRFYNLYLVAHQDLRRKALFPCWADPNIDIKLREYCTLELIGKSRTYGTVFPNDVTFGRYRIMLMAKGFITQYQEMSSSPIEHHLKRFSQSFKDNIVLTLPSNKGIFRGFSKRIKLDVTIADDEHEPDDDEEEEDGDDKPIEEVCLDPGRLKVDRDILNMVYDYIARSQKGRSQLSIRRKLRLPKFHVRNHIKNLVAVKMIGSIAPTADKNSSSERMYKASYKTKFKRRKLVPVMSNSGEKQQSGVKAKWDNTDLKAKKILGYRRSAFSQAEDSLLIMCRITSILICPKSRPSYCVHKRVVRNILHGEFVESVDKTSDACLRRIKYLKRLPNNVMSINELTAELRDDPDIIRLTELPMDTDEQLNRVFKSTLRTIRAKIPHLLGIHNAANMTSIMPVPSIYLPSPSATGLDRGSRTASGSSRVVAQISFSSSKPNGETQSQMASISMTSLGGGNTNRVEAERRITEIKNHADLREHYELFDCDSVASMNRTPTFERAKNSIDAKFNNCAMATLAFAMAFSLDLPSQTQTQSSSSLSTPTKANVNRSETKRRAYKLLDKFYSNYPDKMVSSVLSKLNKRSLLTRKIKPTSSGGSGAGGGAGPATAAAAGPPSSSLSVRERSRTALKLNQNVLFLLNRHQSGSLMKLADSIASKLSSVVFEEETTPTAVAESRASGRPRSSSARRQTPSQQTNQLAKTRDRSASQQSKQAAKLRDRLDLVESNDMASTALLSSLCSLGASCQLELQLKIPAHVVSIDQGNENFKSLFDRSSDSTKKILAQFISRCGQSVVVASSSSSSSLSAAASGAGEAIATHSTTNQESPPKAASGPSTSELATGETNDASEGLANNGTQTGTSATKVEDSRRALFLLRHELRTQALDKCGNLADCLVVQPCNVKFSATSLGKLVEADTEAKERQYRRLLELVASVSNSEARLWTNLDGSLNGRSLFKLIESVLSWIIVMPGIESRLLRSEFSHLMPGEHMLELLRLMEELNLIACSKSPSSRVRPKLFGWTERPEADEDSRTFEATPIGFMKYCYLLGSMVE